MGSKESTPNKPTTYQHASRLRMRRILQMHWLQVLQLQVLGLPKDVLDQKPMTKRDQDGTRGTRLLSPSFHYHDLCPPYLRSNSTPRGRSAQTIAGCVDSPNGLYSNRCSNKSLKLFICIDIFGQIYL